MNSLFQNVERDLYDNIIGCKMYDLVHDLAQSVSKSESYKLEDSKVTLIPHVWHLALYAMKKQ